MKALVILLAAISCLAAAGCSESGAEGTTTETVSFADRGEPVSVLELVAAFRAAGITLEINVRDCPEPSGNHATNLGSNGLRRDEAVARREGDVLCGVGSRSIGSKIRSRKYPGETETYVDALNVNCSLYPYNAASEARQVRRLRRAFAELVASDP